jgi:hypothetical protein
MRYATQLNYNGKINTIISPACCGIRSTFLFDLFFDEPLVELLRPFDLFFAPEIAGMLKQEGLWEESQNGFKLRIEIPRFSKEEVKINIENGTLNVYAEKRGEHENQISFAASYSVPVGGDIDSAKASLENGVLILDVKKYQRAKARSIELH